MELSKNVVSIDQEVYMLTSFLVDIGGISRAVYASGLVIAHFAAMQIYKAAMINDLFMV